MKASYFFYVEFDVSKIDVFIIKNNYNRKEIQFSNLFKNLNLTNNYFEMHNLIKRNIHVLNI
jgi:hypothetical protein